MKIAIGCDEAAYNLKMIYILLLQGISSHLRNMCLVSLFQKHLSRLLLYFIFLLVLANEISTSILAFDSANLISALVILVLLIL